jgi:hypothetical protein
MGKTTVSASSTHSFDPIVENGARQPVGRYSWRLTPFLLMVPLSLVLLLGAYCAVAISMANSDTAPSLHQVYLTDLDGNGHLDAFLVPLNDVHRTLANDGSGRFTLKQEFTMRNRAILALGDLNNDGRADVILNRHNQQGITLACATAPEELTAVGPADVVSSHPLAIAGGQHVVACCKGGTSLVDYGPFTDHRPCLGSGEARSVALADLNGNGHLDAFLAKGWGGPVQYFPNEVWFNDGQGGFSDSGQRLGNSGSLAVVLGDLNGNGFVDAVVGNRDADEIWFNDGQGHFSDSGQRLGSGLTHTIFLADLNNDGHPDLFLAGNGSGRVWLNDGTGRFSMGQRIRYGRNETVALGDVTGNGHPDLFVVGLHSYRVWEGEGNGRFRGGLQTRYR